MTGLPKPRPHLVERAVEALRGTSVVDLVAANAPGAVAPAVAPRVVAPPVPPHASPPPPAAPQAPPIRFDVLRQAGLVASPVSGLRSRLTEELSVVQHQVMRAVDPANAGKGRSERIVLVTSARPGEGKTFVSLNLAGTMAASGTRPVLLVDADGKPGSLSDLLGIGDAPGLRRLAADRTLNPASLIRAAEFGLLSVLPYGVPAEGGPVIPPTPMVAAAVMRLAAALPEHVIVLDTPPCLATSDPGNLAPIAGQVVMVVEAERTQRSELEASLDMVDACPVIQLLLNRARLTSKDSFGAYGYGANGAYGAKPPA